MPDVTAIDVNGLKLEVQVATLEAVTDLLALDLTKSKEG
jgi:hypothetical protein